MSKLRSLTLTLPLVLMGISATAIGGEISTAVSVDYVSEYVFRGVSYQRGAVQPGIEFGKNGFTVGVWSSAALGETSSASIDEIDVYGAYAWALADNIDASAGFTIYHFPDTPGNLLNFGQEPP